MAGDPLDPFDGPLIELEDMFGVDFADLPTMDPNILPLQIYNGLLKIFKVTNTDLNLSDFDGTTAEKAKIKRDAQSPYKAMAYLLAALTTRPLPEAESEDDSSGPPGTT